MGWPTTVAALEAEQRRLARRDPPAWSGPDGPKLRVGGCFVCFGHQVEGDGAAGDPGWAAAAVVARADAGEAADRDLVDVAVVAGSAGGPYRPGALALREGPLLAAAVRSLPAPPDVLLVDATGRDHPGRAGMALHLGAVLDVPTVGVTHRPLRAIGPEPGPERGATAPVQLDGEVVAAWVRTAAGARPLVAHAAWRTDVATAAAVVLAATAPGTARTPAPVREARRAARVARAVAEGRAPPPAATRRWGAFTPRPDGRSRR